MFYHDNTMAFKQGYKVVKRLGETDRAGFGSITQYARRMVYRVNQATIPIAGCGPFAVFDDLGKARDWAGGLWLNAFDIDDDSIVAVVAIEYVPVEKRALWRARPRGPRLSWYHFGDDMESISLPDGMHYLSDGSVIMRSNFPPGTKFANWLTVQRVVPRGE